MIKKKSKKNYYFTEDTQNAIIKYNKSIDPSERNIIYRDNIAYAFDKLAENIIHTFKFYYFDVPSEQVKHDVVSFMVININKFKEGKGKAFSYFSIVAKNWLIHNNNKNYNNYKIHTGIEVLDYEKSNIDGDALLNESPNNEILAELVKFWENNLTVIFKKIQDIEIADSVLYFIKNRRNLDNFNKKYLYLLIRDRTGSKSDRITKVIGVMKSYYKVLVEEFHRQGFMDTENTGSLRPPFQ